MRQIIFSITNTFGSLDENNLSSSLLLLLLLFIHAILVKNIYWTIIEKTEGDPPCIQHAINKYALHTIGYRKLLIFHQASF